MKNFGDHFGAPNSLIGVLAADEDYYESVGQIAAEVLSKVYNMAISSADISKEASLLPDVIAAVYCNAAKEFVGYHLERLGLLNTLGHGLGIATYNAVEYMAFSDTVYSDLDKQAYMRVCEMGDKADPNDIRAAKVAYGLAEAHRAICATLHAHYDAFMCKGVYDRIDAEMSRAFPGWKKVEYTPAPTVWPYGARLLSMIGSLFGLMKMSGVENAIYKAFAFALSNRAGFVDIMADIRSKMDAELSAIRSASIVSRIANSSETLFTALAIGMPQSFWGNIAIAFDKNHDALSGMVNGHSMN